MGLQYYSKKINNSKKFLPISSNIDTPSYANIPVSHHKKNEYPIHSSSSSLSSETSIIKTYINTHTYSAIQNQNDIALSTQTSCYRQNNTYANISKLPSKSLVKSNQASYAALVNAPSIKSSSNTNITIKSKILNKTINNRIYENTNSHQTSINNINLSSPTHIYINLDHHDDTPPIVPIRQISLSSNIQSKEIHPSSICSIEQKQTDIETNSNIHTKKTAKKFEVNMAPNCGDKSLLYRTKIPPTVTQILSSSRQRRTLHRSKRRRRRNSTPFRTIFNSNAMRRQQQQQQQHSNLNLTSQNSIGTNNKWKHQLHKNHQIRSVSNQLYNEIPQLISCDNQSLNSLYAEGEEIVDDKKEKVEIFAYPIQFHGALQHQIFSWYPTKIYNEEELIPQVCSTSENGESTKQDETTTDDEDEELFPHNTFEDFLLRRRPKSTCSTSSSNTNSETISHKIPNRSLSKNTRHPPVTLGLDKNDVDFIHNIIQRTHGDNRVSNRITALREAYIRATNKQNDLLKTKVNILKNDENKKKSKSTMKHSLITSKIRDELQKYDELPIHRRTILNNNDDDNDDTYSANDDYRYHHKKSKIPSTTHRIINFMTTLKRQLQKNFQDIRSRILIESMTISSNHISRHKHSHHNSSGLSHRHTSRPKSTRNIIRHNNNTNNNHSTEQSYPFHRQKLYRTHSNTSQHQFSSFDQQSSQRPRTFRVTHHQQRLQRIG